MLASIAAVACTTPVSDVPLQVNEEQRSDLAQPPVVVFAQPTGDSADYSILMIHGAADALAGQTLDVYPGRSDAEPQTLTINAYMPANDEIGCIEPDRIRPDPADTRLPDDGALLASIDINPGDRFSEREPSPTDRAQLLSALLAGVDDIPTALRGLAADSDDFNVRMIADENSANVEVAVVRIDRPVPIFGDESSDERNVVRWFALLEGTARTGWRRVALEQGEGCAHCDSQPDKVRLRAFGDFDSDGLLNLLLEDSRYEGWSYRVMTKSAGEWISEPALWGGGC